MKAAERDAMLVRIDERTTNTNDRIDNIIACQETQSGLLVDHAESIGRLQGGTAMVKKVVFAAISLVLAALVFLGNKIY